MPYGIVLAPVTKKELSIWVIALASIALLMFFGFEAARKFDQTNKSWATFSKESATVARDLNLLQRHLGYGGFVHNFKDYVLRQDPKYLVAIEDSIIAAEIVLARLNEALPDEGDQKNLAVVDRTLRQYIQKKDEALQRTAVTDPIALDRLVRVDDTAALLALGELQRSVDGRLRHQEQEARESFEGGLVMLVGGSFITLFIVGAGIFMIVLLRRAEAANARLDRAYRRVDQLYEESPNALLTITATGRIFRANRMAEKLLGYENDELVGMAVEELLPERLRDHHVALRNAFMRAPSSRQMAEDREVYVLRKDGMERRVDIRISYFIAGGGEYVLLSVVDVTERFRLLEELKQARIGAVEASEAKSRFLASMSHEIRTPLNAILGILQLVDNKSVPPEIARKLGIAKESGLFLLTLINQVLDFAKIESGSIEVTYERFSVPAMLNAVQSMFKFRTDLRGVHLEGHIVGNAERFFVGDYDHIRQILFNITGNAVKFTETGSIDLLGRVVDIDERRCRLIFEVSDTGPGIPADALETIFDEFSQAEAGVRHGGGTGLGLSISKRLAEAMSGRLEVRSDVGVGTTFTFTVDVDVAEDQDTLVDTSAAVDAEPMCILVAEDNDINQMIVQAMLEQDGHSVTVAKNGQEVVDLVSENAGAFDLILMDIQMPVLDGVQAAVSIRQIVPDATRLPIIALTANAFQDQKIEYLSSGMQHVLTKPLEIGDLRAALARYGPVRGETGPPGADGEAAAAQPGPSLKVEMLDDLKGAIPAEKLADLAEAFMTRSDEIMSLFRKHGDDFRLVAGHAHELAGMLGNMGMIRASEIARKIELAARDEADISVPLEALATELSTTWPEVIAYLSK